MVRKSITAVVLSAAICIGTAQTLPVHAVGDVSQMEYLDRGTVAVKTDDGVYLSWRLLGTENYDTAFDVYRETTKIATVSDSTNYTDTTGGTSYTVVLEGEDVSSGKSVSVWDEQYLTIPLDRPRGGTSLDNVEYTYSPNDVTPADVDGDGEYELILKWEPSNSFDSGQDAAHTGNVYIDCYKLSGSRLWRIDLGININAGAHFTQMAAYDFDLDGKAELALKTAPGSIDGQGNYVSAASLDADIQSTDNTADYRCYENGNESGGRVMSGPEYYTVFQGDTGAALDTVYYPHPRGTINEWGDSWGNRSERYLTAVAYLDGKTPSMIAWRGYYAKTTATAYNLINKRLVKIYDFDTSKSGYSRYAGNGNHNLAVGDVDKDGCDEILCGALCLDNDLTPLWCSGRGHGDALHLADYDPINDGLEYFSVHESYSGSEITGSTTGNDGKLHLGGMTLYDAATGFELFHVDSGSDLGRGMMANVGYSDGYFELWGYGNYTSYGDTDVSRANFRADSTNQRIFWNGDLYDELLDGTGSSGGGSQIKISGKDGRIASLRNTVTNNGTKNNPSLIADLFGDWREEIVARGTDNASLIVYTTVIETENKLYTLMHDRAYRMQVASQNAGYNQPPHIGYYVSEDKDEYDARETAAYIKTVHNGEMAIRTKNLSEPMYLYAAYTDGETLTVKNGTGSSVTAMAYIPKYDTDGRLVSVTAKEIKIGKDGYVGELDANIGDNIYLWTKDMKPLSNVQTLAAPPTEKPTHKPYPTATPTPTPTPTSTPTPTPTAVPTQTSEFVVEDGVLTEYNGTDTEVTVPDEVDGQTVMEIGTAFRANAEITSVTLPETVTVIEKGAFSVCSALEKINLENVVTIGVNAFNRCTALTSADMESVESIGNTAFNRCENLNEITLGEKTTTIGRSAFAYCKNIQKCTVKSMETSIGSNTKLEESENLEVWGYVGSNVQYFANINGFPFYNLETDEQVITEWAVSTDGILCKYNGDAEGEITIPETVGEVSLTTIGVKAFSGKKMTSVIIPNSILGVRNYAFYNCENLKEVTLSAGMTDLDVIFEGCTALEKVTIPAGVTTISDGVFDESPNVTIYCAAGSAAETYAQEKGIKYVSE